MEEYYCTNCNLVFDEPYCGKDIVINDPYQDGPCATMCPCCMSTEIVKAIKCELCDEYITDDYYETEDGIVYCNECITKKNIWDD